VAAIGTAFLRADLLAEPGRTELRDALADYAETRHARALRTGHRAQFEAYVERTLSAHARLWPTAAAATAGDTPPAIRALVSSGVSQVLDAHTRRYSAGVRFLPNVAKPMILTVAGAALAITGNATALQGPR
jgi:hypothetical protein